MVYIEEEWGKFIYTKGRGTTIYLKGRGTNDMYNGEKQCIHIMEKKNMYIKWGKVYTSI